MLSRQNYEDLLDFLKFQNYDYVLPNNKNDYKNIVT